LAGHPAHGELLTAKTSRFVRTADWYGGGSRPTRGQPRLAGYPAFMQVLRHNFSHQFHKIRSLTCNFAGLAVAILLVLSVFLAPSAAAHDVLVASDPEDGAEVEAPSSFTLTFNND